MTTMTMDHPTTISESGRYRLGARLARSASAGHMILLRVNGKHTIASRVVGLLGPVCTHDADLAAGDTLDVLHFDGESVTVDPSASLTVTRLP